jgi:hypothetical protein
LEKTLSRVKVFFEKNPSAILIVGFQVLLIAAAVLMVFGSVLAESVADAAYFVLVAGVVWQLISYMRRSHEE